MPAFSMKAIRPRRKIFDEKAFREGVTKALKELGDEALSEFEATVSTWKNKPSFKLKQIGEFEIAVGYDGRTKEGKIYTGVDQGVPEHDIVPNNPAGVLLFKESYSAKTAPGVIGSFAGGSRGETVAAKRVHHPGNKPRGFSTKIMQRFKLAAPARLRQVVEEVNNAA